MMTRDDKLFATTLVVAFAGSVLAVMIPGTSQREAIAHVRPAEAHALGKPHAAAPAEAAAQQVLVEAHCQRLRCLGDACGLGRLLAGQAAE
jgi:hypothetical protein